MSTSDPIESTLLAADAAAAEALRIVRGLVLGQERAGFSSVFDDADAILGLIEMAEQSAAAVTTTAGAAALDHARNALRLAELARDEAERRSERASLVSHRLRSSAC